MTTKMVFVLVSIMVWAGVRVPDAHAAVRISKGHFDSCGYGNRGGGCSFTDSNGELQSFELGKVAEKWIIDGEEVKLRYEDAVGKVPDIKEFERDDNFDIADEFKGCPFKMIEKSESRTYFLETNDCK